MVGLTALDALGQVGHADAQRRSGGCSRPVRLVGSSTRVDRATGQVLDVYGSADELDGITWVRCGDRREARCPSCSHEYKGDAWHLIAAGLAGGKSVPETVTAHPAVSVTMTAPSFGPVHGLRRGKPCKARHDKPLCPHGRPEFCFERHRENDPRLGDPLCPDCYDYEGQVLWQYHVPELWRRFSIALTRELARDAGLPVSTTKPDEVGWRDLARVSYSKVAEFQARGVIHFHAAVRLDGPDGPSSAPQVTTTVEDLDAAITRAVKTVVLLARPEGRQPVRLRWGRENKIRPIRTDAGREDRDGPIHPEMLAAYNAKYLTKSTEDFGLEAWVRTVADARLAGATAHTIRILETATEIANTGGPGYERLGECLATLGYRGHPITKTRAWSTTFKALRAARTVWRRQRHHIPNGSGDEEAREIHGDADLETDQTVIVIRNWTYAGRGYLDFDAAARAVSSAALARSRPRSEGPGSPIPVG